MPSSLGARGPPKEKLNPAMTHLRIQRIVGYAELWRYRDKSIVCGSNVDTRADEEFVRGITPRVGVSGAFGREFSR